MRSSRQLRFFKKEKDFGGSLLKGNAKRARPITCKSPMHLVLRSSHAKGSLSFLLPRRSKRVMEIMSEQGKKFGVKVYKEANSGNHLHFIIMPRTVRAYKGFIRAVTGLIARATLGVEKGSALRKKFWDARPFTRLVSWGQDYRNVCKYLMQNKLEALGFIEYTPRKSNLDSC